MRNELTKSYGDPSNSFSFANFFPEAIRGPFEKCSDVIFNIVESTGLFRKVFWPFNRSSENVPLAGASDIERKKAMKKMDKELHPPPPKELKEFKESARKPENDL